MADSILSQLQTTPTSGAGISSASSIAADQALRASIDNARNMSFAPPTNPQGLTPQQMSAQTEQQMRDRVFAQSMINPGQVITGGQTGGLQTGTGQTPVTFQAATGTGQPENQAFLDLQKKREAEAEAARKASTPPTGANVDTRQNISTDGGNTWVPNPNYGQPTGGEYNAATAGEDERMRLLNEQQAENAKFLENSRAAIEAQIRTERAGKEIAQGKETGQTNMQLARMGAYSAASGVAYVNSLEDSHRRELSDLEAQKSSLLLQAEAAYRAGSGKIAEQKISLINDLEKKFYEAQDRRVNRLKDATALQKYNRDSLDQTIGAMAQDGKTDADLPEGWLDAEEKAAGYVPGFGKTLFSVAKKAFDFQQKTLEEKSATERSKAALDMSKDIYNLLDKVPVGTPMKIGTNTYYGTQGAGKVEIDENGNGRMLVVDQTTGQYSVQNLGKVGKAEKGNFEIVYRDGQEWILDENTGKFTPLAQQENDWQQLLPDGTKGGQCGSFVRKLTGVRVGDTLASKKAITDPSIKPEGVEVGDIFVQKTNSPTGHIGIVNGVFNDPQTGKLMFRLTESNYKLDERISNTRIVSADDPKLVGFARPKALHPALMSGSDATPGTQGATPEAPTGAFKVTSPSPFNTGTQTQSQYQAGQQSENRARQAAQLLISGDMKMDDIKSQLPVDERVRAIQLAKENGWKDTSGQPISISAPSFQDFATNMEQEMAKDPAIASVSPQQLQQLYDKTVALNAPIMDAAQNVTYKLPEKKAPKVIADIRSSLEAGDYNRAKDKLKKVALDTADTDTGRQVRGRDNGITALSKLQKDLDAYAAAGGNMNIFFGGAEKIAGKVGATRSPALRSLATRISAALVDYRHAVSGAAFTASEAAQYAKMFPSVLNTQTLNNANIDALLSVFKQANESFYRQQLGNENFDAIFAQ